MLKKVIKNSTLLVLTQVLSRVFAFISVPLLVRGLGQQSFGAFSVATAILSMAGIFAGLGLDQFIIREIAKTPGRKNELLIAGFIIKCMVSIVIIGAILGALLFFNIAGLSINIKNALLFLSCTLLFNGIISLASAYFYGQERMGIGAIWGLLSNMMNLIAIYLAFSSKSSIIGYALAYSISSAITTICAVILVISYHFKGSESWGHISFSFLGTMIYRSCPFMFMGLSLIVYYKIDIILLSYMAGDAATGVYSAAYRFLDALMFLPAALMGALFPAFSSRSRAGVTGFPQIMEKALRYLALLGIPAAAGICILAPSIVLTLYGPGWAESSRNLQILIWGWGLIFINASCPVILNALGYTKLNIITIGIGIFINTLLNIILIPRFGSVGASWATLITEIGSSFLYYGFVMYKIGRFQVIKYLVHPIVGTIIMYILIFSLNKAIPWSLAMPILIPFGVIIYCIYIFMSGALTTRELGAIVADFRSKDNPVLSHEA